MLDGITNDTWVYTPAELRAVFKNAESGSTIVYAVGDLAFTRETATGEHGVNADHTAKYAYKLWLNGEAVLTQKKLPSPNTFEYRVTKL